MGNSDIGVIGLAVMGENLVMNMESHGFTVSVFNRTVEKVKNFAEGRAKGLNIVPAYSMEELVSQLKKPRKIMMMVKAGKPVDDNIEKLLPLLEPGDIIIDGGNSHFPDTQRRCDYVESKGMLYIGCGVSGGELGALKGPSLMPGGSAAAWEQVRPILQAIAAKTEDGTPCCQWVGDGGAGHGDLLHRDRVLGHSRHLSSALHRRPRQAHASRRRRVRARRRGQSDRDFAHRCVGEGEPRGIWRRGRLAWREGQ